MLSFESDYINGAHPEILKKLIETNNESQPGYGNDIFCSSAKEKIKLACKCPQAEVEFIAGGTQSNAIVISTMLRDWEGVVAAETGHVSIHEAGAIEYTGHKVLEIPGNKGKIEAAVLRQYLADYENDENKAQMVTPGMVYISFPTEYGTIYSLAELTEISIICRTYGIPLFIDGARLGYGLAAYTNDVKLEDIASLCDVFYIGGTKVGALCGEAVVYTRNNKPEHFSASIKRRGALLAKGRLLGVQFDTLFTNDLYMSISRHAIKLAEELKKIFEEKGISIFMDSPTNQQFVILNNEYLKKISEKVRFAFWEKYDENNTVVRFATSWSTTEEDLMRLREIL